MMDKLVDIINSSLQPLFDNWPGVKLFGLAELVKRGEATMPAVGEQFVGPDDVAPVIIYHRLTSISTQQPKGGFGDSAGDIINTYAVSLFVYMDKRRTKITATEMILYIQANMPDYLSSEGLTTKVIVLFTGAILNSQTVFSSEFNGVELRMPTEKTMFQINYTLRAQFSKSCYAKCPC